MKSIAAVLFVGCLIVGVPMTNAQPGPDATPPVFVERNHAETHKMLLLR